MDNLAHHKNEQTIALIRNAGAEPVFLPPYSPDRIPIEMMWSKIKCPAAQGRGPEAMTGSNARGLYAACGYGIIKML
jgi:hypothetical protein